MSEFTELELNKDITAMDADEAKETLSEFMEAHKGNQSAYDQLATELDETEAEFKEKLEKKESRIEEFKYEYAEEAADYVNIPAELVAERFSFSEIEQIIEEGAEFSETEDEVDEEPEDDGPLTTFSDQPEKGKREGGRAGDRDKAKAKLAQHGIGGN